MSNDGTNESAGIAERLGANRRDVLLGATGLAVAAATGTFLGGGVANAAPAVGPMTVEIDSLGSFEVLAFSWGASNSGSLHVGGGGGTGKANFQDVSLTKYIDEFSPELLHAVAAGQVFRSARLAFAPSTKTSPVILTMDRVLVTSLSLGGSSGEARLTENMTLNFASFTYSYGNAKTEWDIAKNQ